MSLTVTLAFALAAVLAMVIAWTITHVAMRRRVHALGRESRRLQGEIEVRMNAVQEKRALGRQLRAPFAGGSPRTIRDRGRPRLPGAEQAPPARAQDASPQASAGHRVAERMAGPVRDALERGEERLRQREQDRRATLASLAARLPSNADMDDRPPAEPRERVAAQRGPSARGPRGELTLERLVELAGIPEHCDLGAEAGGTCEDGSACRCMVVRMPQGGPIVIDAGVRLDAYLAGTRASGPGERRRCMARFARHVRDRLRALAGTGRGAQRERPAECVVLFLPGEQYLAAALDAKPELRAEALRRRVILATPSSLLALLRTIAAGWRRQAASANVETIRREAARLHDRVASFTRDPARRSEDRHLSIERIGRAVDALADPISPGGSSAARVRTRLRAEAGEPGPIDVTPGTEPVSSRTQSLPGQPGGGGRRINRGG